MRRYIREDFIPLFLALVIIVTPINAIKDGTLWAFLVWPMGILLAGILWVLTSDWIKRKWYNVQLFIAAWHTGSPDMAEQIIDFVGVGDWLDESSPPLPRCGVGQIGRSTCDSQQILNISGHMA